MSLGGLRFYFLRKWKSKSGGKGRWCGTGKTGGRGNYGPVVMYEKKIKKNK